MSEFKPLSGAELVLAILLAILIPPVGTLMRAGMGTHFWINLILCFFGWLPAVVHNMWLIFFTDPKPEI